MKPLYRIIYATLSFGVAIHPAAATPGDLDPLFNPGVSGTGFIEIRAMAVQPDGKIIIGGNFSTVGGQIRNGIARLNADGTVEGTDTFNPGSGMGGSGPNGLVISSIAVQPDGKILLVGGFTSVNGQPRSRIARLNPDGTVESTTSFDPGAGANADVNCVALQPDGKILIGGEFQSVNGQERRYVARLNSDGTLESTTSFAIGTSGANYKVLAIAVQPDGKILLGGEFSSVAGQARKGIARLNADGTLESTATFNAEIIVYDGTLGHVNGMAFQADGKILIYGSFTGVNGEGRNKIARLNYDGSLESITTFNPLTGNISLMNVLVQADGHTRKANFRKSLKINELKRNKSGLLT